MLHVQDTINTSPDLGMPTTLGAPALLTAEPKANARLIEEVLEPSEDAHSVNTAIWLTWYELIAVGPRFNHTWEDESFCTIS